MTTNNRNRRQTQSRCRIGPDKPRQETSLVAALITQPLRFTIGRKRISGLS